MLLRSLSTPILGSLESPNHHLNSEPHHTIKHPTPPTHHHSLNYISSPLTLESSGNTFRRSISEGNLVGLDANNSPLSRPPKYFQKRALGSTLEPIPSFSYRSTLNEDSDENDEDFGWGNTECFENSSLGLEASDQEVRFSNAYKSLGFVEEQARGLGVGNLNIGFGSGGGRGGDFIPVSYGRDGGDGKNQGAEEHYKNLVAENPGNPLFLRNYAHYLFETKKDLEKSEELYSRAILADPGDGEVLSQYAKLIWELHHDQDRALNYFERAVQATPADSHVHAAYASFLWEIEGDGEEDEDDTQHSSSFSNSQFLKGVMASAST